MINGTYRGMRIEKVGPRTFWVFAEFYLAGVWETVLKKFSSEAGAREHVARLEKISKGAEDYHAAVQAHRLARVRAYLGERADRAVDVARQLELF